MKNLNIFKCQLTINLVCWWLKIKKNHFIVQFKKMERNSIKCGYYYKTVGNGKFVE